MHFVSAVWGLGGIVMLVKVFAEGAGSPHRAGVIVGNVVMTTVGEAAPVIRGLAGLLMCILAVALWCGVGRALPGLALVALVVVALPGLSGAFDVLVLMPTILLGTLPLMADEGLGQVADVRGAR